MQQEKHSFEFSRIFLRRLKWTVSIGHRWLGQLATFWLMIHVTCWPGTFLTTWKNNMLRTQPCCRLQKLYLLIALTVLTSCHHCFCSFSRLCKGCLDKAS